MNEQIIAVDFDGTLCENKWPEIGEPNTELISYLIEMRKTFDAKIILWTCRAGEMLDKAVNWCSEHGLEFDAVNENLPHIVERFGSDTRKIFANVYIDDRNFWYNDKKVLYLCDGGQCENGKRLSAMPQEYLNREIKEVTSSGGWTRMDYILTLK